MSLNEFVSILARRGLLSELSRLSRVSRVTILKCRKGRPLRDHLTASKLSEATRYARDRSGRYVYSPKAKPMVSIGELWNPAEAERLAKEAAAARLRRRARASQRRRAV